MAGLLLSLLGGCDADDVAISARCEVIETAVHMSDQRFDFSMGVVDGHTLIVPVTPVDSSETSDAILTTQWFDASFEVESAETPIGTARPTANSKLIARDGSLYAQFWVDATSSIPAGDDEDHIAIWQFAPPPSAAATSAPVSLDLSRIPQCAGCELTSIALGIPGLPAGTPARLPAVLVGGEPVFGMGAIPRACETAFVNGQRLALFTEATSAFVLWGDDPCDLSTFDLTVSNLELIALPENEIGALFRLGDRVGHGHVHYLRFDADLEPVSQLALVGGEWIHVSVDLGYQPKAAYVGGRVLWTERIFDNLNGCEELRMMNADGSEPRPAAWQLPCYRDAAAWHTTTTELFSLDDGHVAIVWNERSALGGIIPFSIQLTTDIEWRERILVAILDAKGRLASEPVIVTDADATALSPTFPREATSGPFPADFAYRAALDGTDVTVVWSDRRRSRPGLYGARVRCVPNVE